MMLSKGSRYSEGNRGHRFTRKTRGNKQNHIISNQEYDVAFSPVISPDGQTILYTHDGNTPLRDTIYTMPIGGEIGATSFTGLFGAAPNFVSPGDGSSSPIYSPNGSTIFFLNNNAGFGGSIPIFGGSGVPFDPRPDWDLIYKRDSGGTVTAVTAPGDGDIVTGGTPTRISDDLPWSGDVSSFAIAPNGTQVAYVAGQNTSANSELFLTPITGGTGNSIRVSDPAPSNSGAFDVSTSISGGQIVFSNDSSQIYYLGDFDTEGVRDLYVVDTTEKTGLEPSPFTFVGATIVSSDRFGMRFELDITVIDTQISVTGESSQDAGGPGQGDVEDIFSGAQGGGSTLTLDGASTLLMLLPTDGDFDGDGDVDGFDFLTWQRGFGTTFNASDLAAWETNYGSGAGAALASAANVPEPTSALLLFIACSFCGMYRQARKA